MGVSLSKGENVTLDRGLKSIAVGLGWDERDTEGDDFDLDASAFLLTERGKVRNDADFIFYNQLKSVDGSVAHTGDNLDGAGEGDAEVINIDLVRIPTAIMRIAFAVTIHEADRRKQTFGQVQNAYIRLVDRETDNEIARFDLGEDAGRETAMIFGEVYRRGTDWKFKAVGQGYKGGLRALATGFGVNVSG